MPTLEQQLADAIDAQNRLTQAVASYKSQIDSAVVAQKQAYDAWKAGIRGEYPMPPNMIKNTYMDAVTNGIPDGYSTSGLTIAAVHPYTKGFEGTYTPTSPAGAVTDPATATSDKPFWYGMCNKGPRFPVWGGGLADGWGGLGGGNILKVTGAYASGTESRQVYFPMARRVYAPRIGFRAWVHLAKGSELRIGSHAGYLNNPGSVQLKKSDIASAPQGWKFVDIVINTNAGMWVHGNCLALGFSCNEEIEAYIAMPYLYTMLNQDNVGTPMGE